MLETALETGIASMGVDTYLLGPLPTPGVAFMTRSMRADAGIMISASHNPYEDNGIKFFGADGFKLDDETELEIERLMSPGSLDQLRATPDLIGKAYRIEDAVGRYTVYLKSCLDKDVPQLDGLKVVIDSAHGAAYRVAPLALRELGAEVISIGNEPDGKNINLGFGSLHPEKMAKLVVEHGADCGIAFDGDADRLIVCDEKGDILDGDHLLAMFANDLKAKDALPGDAVVGTVMSNLGLERALKDRGLRLLRSGVGDRYVLSMMQENGVVLGGEQSGHMIFLDNSTTGDGILSALMTLSVMIRSGRPLSEHRALLEKYPQVLKNIRVENKIPFDDVPAIQRAVAEAEKTLGTRGRLLLRYSGTEKKARVMVEAEDLTLCDSVADMLIDVLSTELS
jgi:phosphoglucosamine mutase